MSRGLGRVQRDVVEQVCRYEFLTTRVASVHLWVEASAPSISRAIASLERNGYIVRSVKDGEDVLKATSKGRGAWAKLQDAEI